MESSKKKWICHRVILLSILLFTVLSSSSQALAGTKLYTASWISESFGNDIVGIGTGSSRYFSLYPIPWGHEANDHNPLCHFRSTPATSIGAGTLFNPLGPDCRLLTTMEPRPPKFGTLTPLGGTCPGAPASPCSKTAPLYRNPLFFTAGGQALHTNVDGYLTVAGSPATMYLTLNDSLRGIGMKAAPLEGGGSATTSTTGGVAGKFNFNFPAANPAPATDGFRRLTVGSFGGYFPYLYSYTYADLRNDAGQFGVGQGFFSASASYRGGAPRTMVTYSLIVGGGPVHTVNITRGSNTYGGVMKLLGSYTNKVCFFYQGGCGLGYGTWQYELIGAAGQKNPKATAMNTTFGMTSSVITAPFTTQKSFMYFNTAIKTVATYTNLAERWPWTTGTVTVRATGRGQHDTVVRRIGFDHRDSAGVGTVQLVSPVVTQWLGGTPASMSETGGVAVMQIRFVPEPGVVASLICGIGLLMVLKRYHA